MIVERRKNGNDELNGGGTPTSTCPPHHERRRQIYNMNEAKGRMVFLLLMGSVCFLGTTSLLLGAGDTTNDHNDLSDDKPTATTKTIRKKSSQQATISESLLPVSTTTTSSSTTTTTAEKRIKDTTGSSNAKAAEFFASLNSKRQMNMNTQQGKDGRKGKTDLPPPPIHQQKLKLIAPNHPTWTDEDVHIEFSTALDKIKNAPIVHEPFDHFYVENLFSDKFYDALMKELPPPTQYNENSYAGTAPLYPAYQMNDTLVGNGTHVHIPSDCSSTKKKKREECGDDERCSCWIEKVRLHDSKAKKGLTLTVEQDVSRYPLWLQTFRLIHSRNFTQLLYTKFATPTGIPLYKQRAVQEQAAGNEIKASATIGNSSTSTSNGSSKTTMTSSLNLRNTAALRIEPTSYHLTPHVDRYEKLVTWQYFHPESDELQHRGVGTQFYEMKSEYKSKFEIEDKENPNWLDYKYFDTVKEQPVLPNYFFSFAPNNHSWHGAAIDPSKMDGVNQYSRRTFLGFITTKFWEYHHFSKNDWAPEEYDFTL